MRIACVASDDLGIILFCRTMSRILAARGHELITVGEVGDYQEELSTVISTHVDVRCARYVAPLADLRYAFELYRVFRRHRVDAVITFATKPNIAGPAAARLAGVKTICVAVRGLGQAFDPPAGLRARMVRTTLSWLYRLSFRLCTVAWFTNPGDRTFFVESGACSPEKVHLTPNAVDTNVFNIDSVPPDSQAAICEELEIEPADQCVIMVARLLFPKGVREFVEAARMLQSHLPRARFLLVGPLEPGSPSAIPEDFIRDADKAANLTWLGYRKDVVALYAISDLAVLPSYYKEGGYPRALLEPMALGKPVIAADTPDCRAPVVPGENGLLVPPGDATALADAIETILSDSELATLFGKASRRRVEQYFNDQAVFTSVLDRLGIR